MIEKLHQLIPGATVADASKAMILGVPIRDSASQAVMQSKTEELERMAGRLEFDAHSAFYLLTHCLWIPKLQYLLRAAPIYRQQDLLKPLDETLRAATSTITNVRFGEANWEQATLPTRFGGLGPTDFSRRFVQLLGIHASLHGARDGNAAEETTH